MLRSSGHVTVIPFGSSSESFYHYWYTINCPEDLKFWFLRGITVVTSYAGFIVKYLQDWIVDAPAK